MVLVRGLFRFLNITTAFAYALTSFHSNDCLQIFIQELSSVPNFLIICQPSMSHVFPSDHRNEDNPALSNKQGMSYFQIASSV